jgi:Zn-dependent protease with chaperone function
MTTPLNSRLAAFGIGIGILVAAIGLLIGGWFLGLGLAPRLDRASATLVNLLFTLAPAAVLLAKGNRKSVVAALTGLALLLVVMIAMVHIHAGVWTGPHLRSGSGERLLAVLSALIWPVLAASAFAAVVSRQTGQRFGRTASLAGIVVLLAVNVSVVWLLFGLLAGRLPTWLMVLVIVSISVVLQFVIESEFGLLMAKRASIPAPLSVAKAKSEVETQTKISVDGPIVVDRGAETSAEVRARLFRPPVLILSAAIARLESAALTAVIAHEYAHVALGHLRMRLWLSIGSLSVFVLAMATLAQAAGLDDPRRPMARLVMVFAALSAHRFLLYIYFRRQEREADRFAASVAGADAMQAALRMTAVGPVIPSSFSMWMTHDGLEARRNALDERMP